MQSRLLCMLGGVPGFWDWAELHCGYGSGINRIPRRANELSRVLANASDLESL
ncbi:hypothetical protein BSFA1_77510 (plasmid) [Burkholderia sp. SFA1]|nr:hypothetical protein BRPE67_ECDS00670 [Burkholderia sp. RPE67]BBQ02623.1 hypothetical protein BSFA1_77510 [Burkholderia sp. SFA1]